MKKTGDEYYDSDEFRDLLSEYEQAVETGQPVFLDPDELAEIADYYQLTEHPDKADDAINLAMSLAPGAVAPLTYKIHEAIFDGDIEAAKGYLGQIIDKDDPDYIYDKAEILISEGKIDEADNYLREQLATVPPDEYQDYVVDIANIYSNYNISDKAMQWMARARQEDTPDFKELMARTLFGVGKYKDSEKLFSELIDIDPFSKHYWNGLASAQFMREDYPGSIESSEFAIAIDPNDPDALLSKANGLFRLGNYEEALNYFRRYSEIIPDDEFSYLHQGTCLINMNRNEEAISEIEKALSLAPEDSPYLCDIYQELAFAYAEEGRTEEAIETLNKTDALDCDHVQMTVIKGHVFLAAGREKDAQQQFYRALSLSDNAPQTLMRIIVSLYDNKYCEAAYRMFRRFFRMVPEDYNEGYAYMALCCYDLKKYDEFLYYLKTACERNISECRLVLSHLFPKDVEPKDYYEYIKDKMK